MELLSGMSGKERSSPALTRFDYQYEALKSFEMITHTLVKSCQVDAFTALPVLKLDCEQSQGVFIRVLSLFCLF